MKKKVLMISVLVGLFFLGSTMSANATSFGFDNITNNNAADAAIGEAQLFVDVTDPESGQVLFTFRNIGPAASSIAQVYFDDGSLLGIDSIINGTGVSFSVGAGPVLPGGNTLVPPFVPTFSAGADSPVQPNGVNPGETLGISFNLLHGQTFGNVLAALGSGDLRIGIHVQGFASDGSESFVNNPVPEPATMLLLGSGLIGIAGLRRKSKKS